MVFEFNLFLQTTVKSFFMFVMRNVLMDFSWTITWSGVS